MINHRQRKASLSLYIKWSTDSQSTDQTAIHNCKQVQVHGKVKIITYYLTIKKNHTGSKLTYKVESKNLCHLGTPIVHNMLENCIVHERYNALIVGSRIVTLFIVAKEERW